MSYSYVLDRVEDLEEKITALEAENAKLRAVVEAAKAMACKFEADSMSMNEIDALRHFRKALEKLEEIK